MSATTQPQDPQDPQDSKALRSRTIDALLTYAALDDDPGGAGYSEGMAQNYRARSWYKPSEPYVEGIEAAIALLLPEVETVNVDGAGIRVKCSGRWGVRVACDSRAHANSLAAHLAGVGA